MGDNTIATKRGSTSMGVSTEATGDYSTAMGISNSATGKSSTAMGGYNAASGNYSTVMGQANVASGLLSACLGTANVAHGTASLSMGIQNEANSYCQVNLGRFSNKTTGSATTWVSTDPVFVIGNGKSDLLRRDALVVLKNGNSTIYGDLHVGGTLSKSAGSFKIDHPQDLYNKYLYHSFVESPDMMNIYNGNIITNSEGNVTVQLPDYFESLNYEFRYQLTVIGQFAQAIIFEKINDNQFKIKTDKPNVEVSWLVTGVRNDRYAKENRIIPEVVKEPLMQGKLLYNPE